MRAWGLGPCEAMPSRLCDHRQDACSTLDGKAELKFRTPNSRVAPEFLEFVRFGAALTTSASAGRSTDKGYGNDPVLTSCTVSSAPCNLHPESEPPIV
jgi:hypothetical protein